MRFVPIAVTVFLTGISCSCQHHSDGAQASAVPLNTKVYFETEGTAPTVTVKDLSDGSGAVIGAFSFESLKQNEVSGQWLPTPAFLSSELPYPKSDLTKLVAATYAQAVQSQKFVESDEVLARFQVAPRATSDYIIKPATIEVRVVEVPGQATQYCQINLKIQAWNRTDEALAAVGTADLSDLAHLNDQPTLLPNKPACVLYTPDTAGWAFTQPTIKSAGKIYFMSIAPETMSELVKVAIKRLQTVAL